MPLPKEYYNIIGQGSRVGIKTYPNMSPPGVTYPDYFGTFEEPLEVQETGGLRDLAESFGAGAISGLTWSAVDLKENDWEDMNTMERSGWILGEGASLFLPIGPFGMLGKAGRSVARGLGNSFVDDIAKKAAKLTPGADASKMDLQQADILLKGINTVAKKTGKKTDDILNSLEPSIQRGLRDVLGDDIGIRWVNELGIAGNEAVHAHELLVRSGGEAVRRAFVERGLGDITQDSAEYISGKFVKGLQEGHYVNDVAEWIERGIGGTLPEGVSKYLGMAAQDLLMMGIHSVGVGKIAEHLRGEAFDTNTALSHSVMMSLAFPAIRLLPNIPGMGSGAGTIQQGMQAYWRSYRNTNYKNLAKIHGDDTVRGMASIMAKGQFKDLINKSALDKTIRMSDGTVYHGTGGIESKLFGSNAMPMKHVYEILDKYKTMVGREIRSKWGREYLVDIAGSAPRMGLGVLAMNHAIFSTGMFNEMEGPELASHIFMSAIMTKGQGAWGRDTARTYMADFTPYYEALRLLGASPKSLQKQMRTYTNDQIMNTHGASFATDPIGRSIEQNFDIVLSKPGYRDRTAGEFLQADHAKVEQFAHVYNAIKKMRDPNMTDDKLIDPRRLNRKTLDELSDSIDNIKIDGTKTIKEVGMEGTMSILTSRPADKIQDMYGKMIQEMADTYGIKVRYEPNAKGKDKISGELITDVETLDSDGVMTYNRTMQALQAMGRADITGERQSIRTLANRTTGERDISEINKGLNKIAEKWMGNIDSEYGGKKMYHAPYDAPYMDFMGEASVISTKNFIRKVISNDGSDPDAGRLATSMNNLFMVRDNATKTSKLRESIDDYKFEKGKNEGETAELSQAKETLRPLFELIKKANGGKAQDPSSQKTEITIKEMTAAADVFKERFNSMPERYRENFYAEGLTDLVKTKFALADADPRAIYVATAVAEEGLGYIDGNQLVLPTRKYVSEIDGGGHSSKTVLKAQKALDRIATILGPNVRRDNYSAVEATNKDLFAGLTMEQIFTVDKAIGNKTVNAFLTKGIEAATNIQFKNSRHQEKLEEIKVGLDRTRDSFDSGTFKTTELSDVIKQIETLKDMGVSENKIGELQTNIAQIKKVIERGNLTAEDLSSKIETPFTSVNETVREILTQEAQSKKQVQVLTNKIINLSMLGSTGGGLKQTQTRQLIEDLSAKLRAQQKGESKNEKEFAELIAEYNENGSWTKAMDVLKVINEQVVGQVLSNSRNPIFAETAVELLNTSKNLSKINHKHTNLQTIAKKYNIRDKNDPNSIDPDIINMARDPNDLNSVANAFEQVRLRIFDAYKPKKAAEMWDNFIKEDSMILSNALVNGNFRKAGKINAGLIEFNNKEKFRSNINDDFFDRLAIEGNRDNPYDVWLLDESISIQPAPGLKNKVMSIDFFESGNPISIQRLINESVRVSTGQKDLIKELKDSGFRIDQNTDTFENIKSIPVSPLVYIRPSPGARVLFAATKDNMQKLNTDFSNWFNDKSSYLNKKRPEQKAKFEEIFGDLVDGQDTNTSIRLKFLLMHIDHTRKGQFDKWMAEYSQSTPDKTKIAKLESDIYKRGYLSDGGTTQRLNEKTTAWASIYHPNRVVRDFATKLINNDFKFTSAIVADELFTKDYLQSQSQTQTPFDNRRISIEKLTDQGASAIAGKNTVVEQLINKQIYDVETNKYISLKSSMLDGAKIVDTEMAQFLWANKGGMGEWNGAKTVIFSTGENSMLGKGFAIYAPGISQRMANRGINLLLGESSAKTFTGKSIKGTDIEPFQLRTAGSAGDWVGALDNSGLFSSKTGIGRKNILELDASGIGVQFTSKNVDGVNISTSMFDWQSPAHVKRAAQWMDLTSIINRRKAIAVTEGNEFIRQVFADKEAEGMVYTEGAMGLTKKLVDFGVSSTNPLVRPQLDKMLRNEDYKIFTKVPDRYGEENFIIPDFTGKLSNPVFAELRKFETDKRFAGKGQFESNASFNKAVQFGGIALPQNTGSKKVIDMNQKMFILRDENGADHLVQFDPNVTNKIKADKNYNFFQPFYETYDPLKYKMMGRDANNNISEIDPGKAKLQTSGAFKKNSIKLLEQLSDFISSYNLDFNEVSFLLAGREITVTKNKTTTQIKLDKKLVDLLNPALGATSNAIPKIAKDQPIMRVDRFNGKDMNGTMQINSHDLRATMQRDNDGDHGYSYLMVPHDMAIDYARDMGHKSDYRMLEKSISDKDINIFGIKESQNLMKAGQDATAIGFSQYSSKLSKSRKAIGSIISSRRNLSWLENAGIQYGGIDLIKGFSNKKTPLNTEDMLVLDRMMDIFQNTVDIHGGQNKLMAEKNLRNYFLWGEIPADYIVKEGTLEHSHSRGSVITKELMFGNGKNKDIQRKSLDIMLRTLRKANMMANDTWDTAGSRPPEVWELKQAHADIKSLFANPTKFIVNEIIKDISRLRWVGTNESMAKGDLLARQLMSEFYQKNIQDVTQSKQVNNFLKQIREGTLLPPKELFSFKNKDNAMEYSLGGKTLNEIMESKHYNSDGPYGELNTTKHLAAGYMVNRIVDRVAMHRIFDKRNVVQAWEEFKIPEMVKDVVETATSHQVKNSVTRGVLRTALNKQFKELSNSLRYFNEEKFVNPTKLESIESRLADTADAIRILDKQTANDMVIDKDKGLYFDRKKGRKSSKLANDSIVYEIKGDVKRKKTLKEGDVDRLIYYKETGDSGGDIDYGNLKVIGWVKKGDTFNKKKNRTYLVDKRPIVWESASSNEARYSQAWKEVTGVGRISSRNLIENDSMREVFLSEVGELRLNLSNSYSKTRDIIAKRGRDGSSDLYDYSSAREQNMIDSFMKKWRGSVKGDEMEQASSLMRYILQPQAMSGKYVSDGAYELPYYRVNNRLVKQMFEWAIDNKQINMESVVKDMIQGVEKIHRGERYENDILKEGYQYMNTESYPWHKLGKFGNVVKSLSNGWFASPFFHNLESSYNLTPRDMTDYFIVRTPAGDKMKIKQKVPRKVFGEEKGCIY